MARFVMRVGVEAGKEIPLPEGGELKVGRLPGLGITLVDLKASREHCRVFHQATGWIVEDLGSRNGTYVNSQRIQKRLLQPGDRLRVGQTELEFSNAAPGSPIPPPGPVRPAPVTGAPATAPPAAQAPGGGAAWPPLRPKKDRP